MERALDRKEVLTFVQEMMGERGLPMGRYTCSPFEEAEKEPVKENLPMGGAKE